VLGEIQGMMQGVGRCCALGYRRKIEDGKRNHKVRVVLQDSRAVTSKEKHPQNTPKYSKNGGQANA
jgi:hypothetical protein